MFCPREHSGQILLLKSVWNTGKTDKIHDSKNGTSIQSFVLDIFPKYEFYLQKSMQKILDKAVVKKYNIKYSKYDFV